MKWTFFVFRMPFWDSLIEARAGKEDRVEKKNVIKKALTFNIHKEDK